MGAQGENIGRGEAGRAAAAGGRLTRRRTLVALVGPVLLGCAGQPLYPVLSPPAATAFRAPYAAVWNATLESLGAVPPASTDLGQGRIETGTYSFTMPVQGGGQRGSVATQVLTVSLEILVRPTPEGLTMVQAQTTIHDALTYGFWPGAGGPNSPEGDLFARIAARLPGR